MLGLVLGLGLGCCLLADGAQLLLGLAEDLDPIVRAWLGLG